MKLKGCVFILFAFVLLTGLAPAVLAQDGDPESDYLIFLPVVMRNSSGEIDPPDVIPPSSSLSMDPRWMPGLTCVSGWNTIRQTGPMTSICTVRRWVTLPSARAWTWAPLGRRTRRVTSRPAGTTPGYYQLVSILINGETDPANHVGEGDFIEVLYPGDPLLTIADRSSWPPGSTITFE